MKILVILAVLFVGASVVEARPLKNPLKTADNVELTKFLGTWYEISAIPYFWERGCVGTNANYSLRKDGRIGVLNKCKHLKLDGKELSYEGVAWAEDSKAPAKLKVQFFWPLSAPYWIVEVGQNYEYAITASPSRKYLWILSRTPKMSETLYQQILTHAQAHGFNVSRLVKTPQL